MAIWRIAVPLLCVADSLCERAAMVRPPDKLGFTPLVQSGWNRSGFRTADCATPASNRRGQISAPDTDEARVVTMRSGFLAALLLIVPWVTGCRLGGFSAGVSSDPAGPTFDTSSLGPPGGGRSGQSYGKSGRARLRASTAEEQEGGAVASRPPRRPRTLSSPAEREADSAGPTASLNAAAESDTLESDEPAHSRALPVSSEEPEVLGRSPRPKPVRTIPTEETSDE